MCLYVNSFRIPSDIFHPKQHRTFYKIVSKVNQSSFNSFYRKHRWKAGWNISDYDKKLHGYQQDIVTNGIHVYITKPKYCGKSCAIIPVICYRKDLLGIGDDEAAFTKVYLEKRSIRRIMQKIQKQKLNSKKRK